MKVQAGFSVVLCCFFVLFPSFVQADPLALVQDMYSRLFDPVNPVYDDLVQLRPLASTELQKLIDRELICRQQGDYVCNIDSSILLNAQDGEVTDLSVNQTLSQEDSVEVSASFQISGEPRLIVYLFRKQAAGWVLTDVQSRAGDLRWSLVKVLQQPVF